MTPCKPLIIRQSAFFESYLEFESQLEFQHLKQESLSNREMDLIEGMGHTDRIRLAYLFGVIDEKEHGHLQSMAKLRNKLSHTPWAEFDSDEESNIEATAKNVLGILNIKVDEAYEAVEEGELKPEEDDFDIGFSGLDTDLQLLQLSILDVIKEQGGRASISRLEKILPRESGEVRQRCLRMDHIGYLDYDVDEGDVSIREKGHELLKEEFIQDQ